MFITVKQGMIPRGKKQVIEENREKQESEEEKREKKDSCQPGEKDTMGC